MVSSHDKESSRGLVFPPLLISALGLPWWSRGKDSVLLVKGAQVQSLAGEQISHVLQDQKKKN